MQKETQRNGMMTMRAVSILLYHEIGPHPRSSANLDCFCKLAAFRLQMRFLKEHGIPVISAREARECMASHSREDTGAVVLTFDDADISFLEYALPVLDEFGYPSTIFAVAGRLGSQALWVKDERNAIPLMTASQLKELDQRLVEIGSHSMTHRKLPELSALEAARELRDSKARLEDVLCRPVTAFAYPHGRYDAFTIELVAAAGYQYAYCTDGQRQCSNADDRFLLPRRYITCHDGIDSFAKKLDVIQ